LNNHSGSTVELRFYELIGTKGVHKPKCSDTGICIAVNKLRGLIMYVCYYCNFSVRIIDCSDNGVRIVNFLLYLYSSGNVPMALTWGVWWCLL